MELKQEILERFGANLRAKREERGWSIWKLSRESGVSPDTILRYEQAKGERGPSLEPAIQIARALEATLDELTGHEVAAA
jgi:transcriptional regulator with XRE-family HTH domain